MSDNDSGVRAHEKRVSDEDIAKTTPPPYDVDPEKKQGGELVSGHDGKLSSDNEYEFRIEGRGIDDAYARKVYMVNKTINEIGMGRFQYGLFMLSGAGWLVDNLWLQGVAIILPEVRKDFGVANTPWMTFSLYVGLILGAAVWGILADVIGRRPSFNATLAISGIFGIAAGGAPNFVALGGLLAAMGFGLGGNLPVDGMLFLEFIPAHAQKYLTLLSVFWSFGQVIASLVAWAFIANYSCEGDNSVTPGSCPDIQGWRYTFYTLGAFSFVLFLCRFAIFQLPESPKFLISQGRDAEAVAVLKEIARRNGRPLGDDVISVAILRSAAGQDPHMDSDSEALPEDRRGFVGLWYSTIALPKAMIKSLRNLKASDLKPDLKRVKPLFAGAKMAYTTSVVFALWAMIGLAYPLFNAFLPGYIESRVGTDALGNSDTNTTYSQYAYISVCGIPGSFIAAALVELPRSGRRGAMALGTILTGVFVIASAYSPNNGAFLAFNCIEALVQQIMYGVLYSYTPEIFPGPVRGTGDGIASSLNRIAGLFAPIIKIYGSAANPTAPLFVSAALFLFSGVLMLTLQVEPMGKSAM